MKKQGTGLIISAIMFFVCLVVIFGFRPPLQAEIDWEFSLIPWTLSRAAFLMLSDHFWQAFYALPFLAGIWQMLGKPCQILSVLTGVAWFEMVVAWFILFWYVAIILASNIC